MTRSSGLVLLALLLPLPVRAGPFDVSLANDHITVGARVFTFPRLSLSARPFSGSLELLPALESSGPVESWAVTTDGDSALVLGVGLPDFAILHPVVPESQTLRLRLRSGPDVTFWSRRFELKSRKLEDKLPTMAVILSGARLDRRTELQADGASKSSLEPNTPFRIEGSWPGGTFEISGNMDERFLRPVSASVWPRVDLSGTLTLGPRTLPMPRADVDIRGVFVESAADGPNVLLEMQGGGDVTSYRVLGVDRIGASRVLSVARGRLPASIRVQVDPRDLDGLSLEVESHHPSGAVFVTSTVMMGAPRNETTIDLKSCALGPLRPSVIGVVVEAPTLASAEACRKKLVSSGVPGWSIRQRPRSAGLAVTLESFDPVLPHASPMSPTARLALNPQPGAFDPTNRILEIGQRPGPRVRLIGPSE